MTIPKKVHSASRAATALRPGAPAAPKPPARSAVPRTLVVGLGNGGCQTVTALARQWKDSPRIVLVNSDGRSLAHAPELAGVQIGAQVIKGLGTGGEPRMGRRAAEADREAISALFHKVDVVFLVVCLGGGTGTGAAPVLVEAARKAGAFTLCFVSLPFEFEGQRRMEHAQRGLTALQAIADAVICLPNQRLLKLVNDRTNLAEAFQKTDEMLAYGLQALWCLISRRGVINLDLGDIRALAQKGQGRCLFACVEGRGADKVNQILEAVQQDELLKQGAALAEAEALVISVIGGSDLSLKEVDQLMDGIAQLSHSEALMTAGVCYERDWQDRLLVVFLVAEKKGADDLAHPALGRKGAPHEHIPEAAARDKIIQRSLFEEVSRGRFKDVEATIVNGENLDLPTFKRRGIVIQKAQRNHVG